MNITGIIAEYNPFHSGHAYHIQKAREISGADYIVAVMSPDFVQRGEPAVFDKYTRTRAALLGGADLVLELPVLYACASAEYFALGAAALLDGLGAVDSLCFGSETPSLSLFLQSAKILEEEPEAYRRALQKGLRQGLTYPQARAGALAGHIPDRFFSSPNNILGVEYCRALRRLSSSIRPLPLQRLGSGYHDSSLKEGFCSATALRRGLAKGQSSQSLLPYVPEECRQVFSGACRHPVFPDDLMPWLTRQLLIRTDFTDIFDVTADLSDRLVNLSCSLIGKSWEQTVAAVKTRQMTEARIRRVLLHILLNIRQDLADECRAQGPVFYARILGFRKKAGPLLRQLKKSSRLPLLTKPAAAAGQLSGAGPDMLDLDFRVSHLYRSILTSRYGLPFKSEYQMGPLILP